MDKQRMTVKSKRKFQYWLVDKKLTMSKFAKLCGVSHQYIYKVVNGKATITPSVIETFKKGGYEIKIEEGGGK